jgi:hypothetical protein
MRDIPPDETRKLGKMISKNSKYFIVYLIAIIPVLIIHYFLISSINVNSTIQVLIDLSLFMLSLGFSSMVYENVKKPKRRK